MAAQGLKDKGEAFFDALDPGVGNVSWTDEFASVVLVKQSA
jgi:hypothetical protein